MTATAARNGRFAQGARSAAEVYLTKGLTSIPVSVYSADLAAPTLQPALSILDLFFFERN